MKKKRGENGKKYQGLVYEGDLNQCQEPKCCAEEPIVEMNAQIRCICLIYLEPQIGEGTNEMPQSIERSVSGFSQSP